MKKERNIRLKKLAAWTWSWVATLALATFGPKFIWDNHSFLTAFAFLVNFVNGILMIIANRNLFNHYDELERKIHLEAMAITLGLSVVVGLTYDLLTKAKLLPGEGEISYLVMFIGVCYLLTFQINQRRYS